MAFPETIPILKTDRLVLRELREDDAAALFEILSDPVTMRYWSTPPWSSPDQAVEMIARAREGFAASDALRFGIVETAGGALIGTCTLFGIDATHRRAEIGYILAREWWRNGLMTEALSVLLDYAFGPLGLHRVEADVDPRNYSSLMLLRLLGFSREGFLRERWRVTEEVTNSVFLGLLAPEWTRGRSKFAVEPTADTPTQWPEDWQKFHLHGLAYLIRSRRVMPALFADGWDGEEWRLPHLIPPKGRDEDWINFVMSRLWAGLGAQLLLQGLYLKRGYSLRQPGGPGPATLARQGEEARRLDPRYAATLEMLLEDVNLSLLGNPRQYAALRIVQVWQDQAAQASLGWTFDATWGKYDFGLAVKDLHVELIADTDEAHREAVRRVLAGEDAPR